MSCIFCKIIDKKTPANLIYEDESIICFKDAAPQAPVHCLVVPRKHIADLFDLKEDDIPLMARLMSKIPEIAKLLGLEKQGFRLICNSKEMAGQSVFHLHFHIMGGRSFRWPPGYRNASFVLQDREAPQAMQVGILAKQIKDAWMSDKRISNSSDRIYEKYDEMNNIHRARLDERARHKEGIT